MTVDELGRRLTSREVSEWHAYEKLHGPVGPERTDYQNAQIVHVIAEVNRDRKRRSLPYRLRDFLLFKKPKRDNTPEEDRMAALRWAYAAGGKVKKV